MRRFQRWSSVALTGIVGVANVMAALVFRGQIALSRRVAYLVGFCILYGGMALFVWAAFYLRGAISGGVGPFLDRVVTEGPFRIVRHPLYVAMTLAMIGASIVTKSAVGLLMAVLLFLPAEIHRARLEERELEEKFGSTWRDYAARTAFFFPRLGRKNRQ